MHRCRDYIHVVDLALGHLKHWNTAQDAKCVAINLDGVGYPAYGMVNAFERASDAVPHEWRRRRGYRGMLRSPALRQLLGWSPHSRNYVSGRMALADKS